MSVNQPTYNGPHPILTGGKEVHTTDCNAANCTHICDYELLYVGTCRADGWVGHAEWVGGANGKWMGGANAERLGGSMC